MQHFHPLYVLLNRTGIWKLFYVKKVEVEIKQEEYYMVHLESEIQGNPQGGLAV